eukprot:5344053-Amphidinium_carterae.1
MVKMDRKWKKGSSWVESALPFSAPNYMGSPGIAHWCPSCYNSLAPRSSGGIVGTPVHRGRQHCSTELSSAAYGNRPAVTHRQRTGIGWPSPDGSGRFVISHSGNTVDKNSIPLTLTVWERGNAIA